MHLDLLRISVVITIILCFVLWINFQANHFILTFIKIMSYNSRDKQSLIIGGDRRIPIRKGGETPIVLLVKIRPFCDRLQISQMRLEFGCVG